MSIKYAAHGVFYGETVRNNNKQFIINRWLCGVFYGETVRNNNKSTKLVYENGVFFYGETV